MRPIGIMLAAVLVACAACVACGGKRAEPPPISDPLDRQAALAVRANHLLGAVVGVERDGRVILERAYGFADLARTRPLTAGDELAIGSLTKQFTAAAVLQLVDDGKIALDAPISTYVPEVAAPVTIRQLLNHTSGLPDYATGANLGKSRDELLAIIGASTPAFPPGTRYAYSNTSYWLLARVTERVTGQPYADVLRARVLAPAGLTATHPCKAPAHVDGSSLALEAKDPIAWPAFDIQFYDGAGELCSTVADLLRWNDALHGGKVVSPASLAFMTTPPVIPGARTQYGAGLIAATLHGKRMYLHTGMVTGGFESELVELPDDHVSVAILSNTASPIARLVTQTIAIDLANSAIAQRGSN
jgi:CubicO group peptidase (beta-lactamase class C family)